MKLPKRPAETPAAPVRAGRWAVSAEVSPAGQVVLPLSAAPSAEGAAVSALVGAKAPRWSRAGSAPLWLGAVRGADGAPLAGHVTGSMARSASGRLAVDLTVDTASARSVDVALDTAGLAGMGANYVDRMRVRVGGVQVPSRVDPASHRLVVNVPVTGAGSGQASSGQPSSGQASSGDATTSRVGALATSRTVSMLATAGATGSSGDFTSTSLSPSMAWDVGLGGGNWTYSYPLPVAPASVGPAPSLALSYDSGSVDGRTSAENGQVSDVGTGWSMPEAFIERSYLPCAKESDAGSKGMTSWGDKCWGNDTLSLVMDGASGELIPTGTTADGKQRYRLRDDNGWQVLRSTGSANGGEQGEYFSVQSPDGMEYMFGVGWSRDGDGVSTATNAVATIPVFGDDPKEACYNASTGKPGVCNQGYRFYMTSQVDKSNNSILYLYDQDTNKYASKGTLSNAVTYTRDTRLASVLYGRYAEATSQVQFIYTTRCDEARWDPSIACPSMTGSPSSYPDVPTDLICSGSSCTSDQMTPTFFSTKRLSRVRTLRRFKGSGDSAPVWRNVERVDLSHHFADPDGAGGDSGELWLDTITRTGFTNEQGSDLDLPPVIFDGTFLQNRVDDGGGVSKLFKQRITQVRTELGGVIKVTYGHQNACTSDTVATSASGEAYRADTNTNDCFPRWWTPASGSAGFGWFHKYLVMMVTQESPTTGEILRSTADERAQSEPIQTQYAYFGSAAWHYDDSKTAESRTQSWSDWRGYQHVAVKQRAMVGGVATGSWRSLSHHYFFRGMDGDHLSGGSTRSVTVSAEGSPAVADFGPYHGRPLEEDAHDGADVAMTQVSHSYLAKHTAVGSATAHDGFMVREAQTLHRVANAGSYGPGSYAIYDNYSYAVGGDPLTDPSYGMLTFHNVNGATGGDHSGDTCTQNEYETDGALWQARVTRTRVFGPVCPSGTTTATLYRAQTFAYDSLGRNTTARTFTSNLSTTSLSLSSLDSYGRVWMVQTCASDGSATTCPDATKTTKATTSFSPAPGTGASSGAVTSVTGTQFASANQSMSVVTELDGFRDLPVKVTGADGQVTTQAYDNLGRLTSARLPGDTNDRVQFAYGINQSVASKVITVSLVQAGSTPVTRKSVSWVDGFGRPVMTEVPAPSGTTRILSTTRYDDRGNVEGVSGPLVDSNAVGAVPWANIDPATMATEARTAYDALGRVTESQAFARMGAATSSLQHRTITTYGPGRSEVATYKGALTTSAAQVGGSTVTRTDAYGIVKYIQEYKNDDTLYATTSMDYDPVGQLRGVGIAAGALSPPSKWTTLKEYDLAGRVTKTTDADAGVSTTTYNWLGLPTKTTSPSGPAPSTSTDEVVTDYDLLGRVLTTKLNNTLVSSSTYDTGGGLFTGRLVSQTATQPDPGNSNNPVTFTSTVLGYDVKGRPTGTRLDVPAGFGVPAAVSYTETPTYDTEGHVATVSYPAIGGLPAETVTASWANTGVPSTLKTTVAGVDTQLVAATGYNTLGQLASRTWGNASTGPVRAYTYDGLNRLAGVTTTIPGASPALKQNDTYAYGQPGRLTQVTDNVINQAQCYTYDDQNRLLRARTQDVTGGTNTCTTTATVTGTPPADAAPYDQSWSYDEDNNLTQFTDNLAGASTVLGRQASNQPLHAATTITRGGAMTTLTYDAAGRLTKRALPGNPDETLTWDGLGRLVKSVDATSSTATAESVFAYGPDGSRIIRKTATETTLTLGATEVVYPAGGGSASGRRYYTLGGAHIGMRSATAAGVQTLTWLANDGQGSTDISIDATTKAFTRTRYTPYGRVRSTPGLFGTGLPTTDHGWLGQTLDKATGLNYLNARYYDNDLAQFTAPDPLLDVANPRTINPYTYAAGNPVAYSDAGGLSISCPVVNGQVPASCNDWASTHDDNGNVVVHSAAYDESGGDSGRGEPSLHAAKSNSHEPWGSRPDPSRWKGGSSPTNLSAASPEWRWYWEHKDTWCAGSWAGAVCNEDTGFYYPTTDLNAAKDMQWIYDAIGMFGSSSGTPPEALAFAGMVGAAGSARAAGTIRAVAGEVAEASGESGALVKYDPMAASRNLLGQVGDGYAVTPGGRTVSAHAAERITLGGPGRSPTTLARVDNILDNPTRIKYDPVRDTVKVMQGKDFVVVRGTGPQHIVTVMVR